MPLRIVGVDAPGGGLEQTTSPLQKSVGVADVTSQALQGAQQAQEQTIQTIQKQTEVQSALMQQKSTIDAQKPSRDFLYNAVKTAGALFDGYSKVQNRQAEQEAEQRKVRQDVNFANTSQEIRDAAFGLRTEVERLGRERGIEVARQRMADILMRNVDISPDAHRQLTNYMYDALDKVDREAFDEGVRNQRDLHDAQVALATAEVKIETQALLSEAARGSNSNEPEVWQRAFAAIETKGQQVATTLGFTELQATALKSNYLRWVVENKEFSETAKAEAGRRLKDLTDFQTAAATIMSAGLPPDQEKALVDALRLKHNQNGSTDPLTQQEVLKERLQLKETIRGLEQLEKQQYLETGKVQDVSRALLVKRALDSIQDPQAALWEEQLKQSDPLEYSRHMGFKNQILELTKSSREKQKEISTLQTRIGKIQGTLAEIQQAKSYDAETLEKLRKTGWNVDWSSETTLTAELVGLQQQLNTITGPLTQDLQTLGSLGVIMGSDGRYSLNPVLLKEADAAQELLKSSNVKPPPFNSGGAASQQPTALKPASDLAKLDIGLVPFLPKDQGLLSITSGYGMRVHPLHGTEKLHDGLDIAGPTGTPVVAVKSGKVIRSEVNGSLTSGYGNYVEVQHADGTVTGYAHLDTRAARVGDVLAQGQKLGTLGSTGGSTGPHLHLSVFKGASGSGIDPVPYLRSIQRENGTQVARGMGLPPQQSAIGTNGMYRAENSQALLLAQPQAPAGSLPLPTGGYVFQGRVYLPDGQFQQAMQYSGRSMSQPVNSNPNGTGGTVGQPSKQYTSKLPMVGTRASGVLRDYTGKSSPEDNYGYETLAKDKDFSRALAATANRLGFPAVWLADIMAFESTQNGITHNPAATNARGAVGLIQFYPGGGLAEVAQDMGVSEGTAANNLRSMTRAQQMRHVERYLQRRIDENGKFTRIDDLFAAIFGGTGLVRKSDAQRQNSSDGNIKYKDYLENIGTHVGRRYHHGLTRGSDKPRTHNTYTAACATCAQMAITGNFMPHKHSNTSTTSKSPVTSPSGNTSNSPLSKLRV